MATLTVHFDRELRHLEPEEAAAWRVRLTQHQLGHMLIACPSRLVYKEPTRRKPANLTVELLTRDPQGVSRSTRTVFSGLLVPFPPGYEVEEQPTGAQSLRQPAAVRGCVWRPCLSSGQCSTGSAAPW